MPPMNITFICPKHNSLYHIILINYFNFYTKIESVYLSFKNWKTLFIKYHYLYFWNITNFTFYIVLGIISIKWKKKVSHFPIIICVISYSLFYNLNLLNVPMNSSIKSKFSFTFNSTLVFLHKSNKRLCIYSSLT